jgi:hypothetical protein
MKAVEKPVYGRRENDTNIGNKDHATEQGVKGGKNFTGRVRDINHGPHTTQDHASIMYRIDPGNASRVMITEYADKDAYDHHTDPQHKTFQDTFSKYTVRGKRLMSVLQHG